MGHTGDTGLDIEFRAFMRSSASTRRRGRIGNEDGFVVLGIIILITVTFVTAVMIGKVVHRDRFRQDPPVQHRELRSVPRDAVVRYGALRTATLPAGSTIWVHPMGAEVAVFDLASGTRIIGFMPDSLLARDPAGQRAGS